MAVMNAARWVCVLVGAAWMGCSSPQPSGGPGSTDGGPATIDGRDERCKPGGAYDEGECDQCLNVSCCNERFACYDDEACYWADEWTLDECLGPGAEDAGTDDAWPEDSGGGKWDTGGSGYDTGGGGWDSGGGSDAGGPSTPEECWKRFGDDDPFAAALNKCAHDHCASVCIKTP